MNKIITILMVLVCNSIFAKSPFKIKGEPIKFLKDAGWCWYEDPRAIINNGKLIIGGISGQSGDIRVGIYDLAKNINLGTVVLDRGFEVDDHNSPVFYARPDGSIIAFWAMHGKENKHYYSISEKDNYLKWSERKVYVHNFVKPENNKWGGVTYMNLYHIRNQGLLFNFFRDGPTYNPTFFTSADNGTTWSKESTHFIEDEVDGRNRPYAKYMQLNENAVGVAFTDGHPRVYGNSLYYASFDGVSFFNADGSKIKDLAEGPLKTTEAEKVFKGSEQHKVKPEGYGSVPDASWTCELERDKNQNPYIGYTLYKSPEDIRFRLANFNGEKWIDREIAFAGRGLYPREDSYSGLIALDPDDPTKVFVSTPVNPKNGTKKGSKHEIYMAQISEKDYTETIDWEQLTFNSEYKNIRPIVVAGEGYKVVLWLGNKPWRHFQDYESDVVGYILDKP